MAKSPVRAVAAKKVASKSVVEKAPAKAAVKALPKSSAKERERFTLYGNPLSGPSYTAALALSLCRHPFSYILVSLRDGAHKQPDFLVKNRFGQVPVLRDGQLIAVQSANILLHLAESLDKLNVKSPLEKLRLREWLFWQWDKLAVPIYRLRARARGIRQFGDEIRQMFDSEARAALAVLEAEFSKSEWIVGKKMTMADVGIYGVLRYAPDANIDLSLYPNLSAWKKRFETSPGFATPEELLPLESRLI